MSCLTTQNLPFRDGSPSRISVSKTKRETRNRRNSWSPNSVNSQAATEFFQHNVQPSCDSCLSKRKFTPRDQVPISESAIGYDLTLSFWEMSGIVYGSELRMDALYHAQVPDGVEENNDLRSRNLRALIANEFFTTEVVFIEGLKRLSRNFLGADGLEVTSPLNKLIELHSESPYDLSILEEIKKNIEVIVNCTYLNKEGGERSREEIVITHFLPGDETVEEFYAALTSLAGHYSKILDYVLKAPTELFNEVEKARIRELAITPVQRPPRYELLMVEYAKNSQALTQEDREQVERSLENIQESTQKLNVDVAVEQEKISQSDLANFLGRLSATSSEEENFAVLREICNASHVKPEDVKEAHLIVKNTLAPQQLRKLRRRIAKEMKRIGDRASLSAAERDAALKMEWLVKKDVNEFLSQISSFFFFRKRNFFVLKKVCKSPYIDFNEMNGVDDVLRSKLTPRRQRTLRKAIDREIAKCARKRALSPQGLDYLAKLQEIRIAQKDINVFLKPLSSSSLFQNRNFALFLRMCKSSHIKKEDIENIQSESLTNKMTAPQLEKIALRVEREINKIQRRGNLSIGQNELLEKLQELHTQLNYIVFYPK